MKLPAHLNRLSLILIAALMPAGLLSGCGTGATPTPSATATTATTAAPTTGPAGTATPPAAASAPAQSPTAGAPQAVTIAVGYVPNVQFAPYYVALEKGYYREEGIEVTLKHGIVPDLLNLLGAGDEEVNFAAASGDEIIPARVQGIPVKYVMTWYRQYPVAAAAEDVPGKALQSPADLRGRTVGVPGPFGANYVGLKALLKAGGLTEDDVKLESIGFTQVESLLNRQVDVAMVYAANEPVHLSSAGMNVTLLRVSDYVALASNGLATNDETLRDNPALVRKVVRATLRGIRDTIDNPKEALDISLKQLPNAGQVNTDLQFQVLQETVRLMQPGPGDGPEMPLGWTDEKVWSTTQDFLFDAKLIPQKGDIKEMFTNEFIER